MRKLESYQPDPHNANRGTERGLGMLDQSLRTLGAGRSILVDRNGVCIAGNKTLERAVELGLDAVEVETDGTQLVVVRRTDLDPAEDARARKLAYADNRVAQVDLDFDPQQLAADIEAGVDLSDFWLPEEMQARLDTDGEHSNAVDVLEVHPEVGSRFVIVLRGKVADQPDVLTRLKAHMSELPGVEVQIAVIAPAV